MIATSIRLTGTLNGGAEAIKALPDNQGREVRVVINPEEVG